MAMYEIVYSKTGILTAWREDLEQARALAARLARAGYLVSLWEHTETGARELAV